MSPLWSKYVHSLTDSVKAIANVLREECSTNQKNVAEIRSLNQEVGKLKHELDVCRKWQNTVYVDMENTIMQYQQYYQSMTSAYMYMGYPNYHPTAPEINPVFHNGVAPSNDPTVSDLPLSTGTSIDVRSNLPNSKSKKVVTESAAVPYGDSINSKKLAERKRFRLKPNMSGSVETDKNYNANMLKVEIKKDDIYPLVKTTSCVKVENTKDKTDVISMECTNEQNKNNSLGTADKSIEETLREAAESVVSDTGFTYDENSGQYYDWNLKMYYDPSTQLYFDHENGIYYYYDTEKKSYIFHTQVEVDGSSKDKPKINPSYDSEPSDGEIISDNESDSSVDSCIRVIVVKSESIDLGTLFVITCKGGTIGRDPACSICIPEDMVSRTHDYVMYDADEKTFYIQDNKTRNGTFLNFERISEAKIPSEPVEITHRDLIKVGETLLSFHIHSRETCFDCEPGNIQAIIAREEKLNDFLTKDDLLNERKRQAKNMRKKYGINPGYLPKSLLNSIPDRAEQRRKEHGVEAYVNYERPVTRASVVKEIPSDNKGHKMLSKMGWKSGEGLGKSGTGIVNPVTINKLGCNEGLGGGVKTSLDQIDIKKSLNWEKARQRYNKCE